VESLVDLSGQVVADLDELVPAQGAVHGLVEMTAHLAPDAMASRRFRVQLVGAKRVDRSFRRHDLRERSNDLVVAGQAHVLQGARLPSCIRKEAGTGGPVLSKWGSWQ
jgi:hypothetical protein